MGQLVFGLSVSNNNTIPKPMPHDNVVTKMELIYHHKDGTHRRHTIGTKYTFTKMELITITKTTLNNHHKEIF